MFSYYAKDQLKPFLEPRLGSLSPENNPEDFVSEDINMNKLPAYLLLLILLQTSVLADFSNAQVSLHPRYPAGGPFIIEINGTWPSDCHPGEQKPVVESWDGHTLEIGFEIIVVHVTCNEHDTPYRSLIDLSEAIRTMKPVGGSLDMTVSFDGENWVQTLQLVCPEADDCAAAVPDQGWVDPGIYIAPDRPNQGLLVARQNAATAIYPLVYDESGGSEWLLAGNRVNEDAFFSEILLFSGGDCFDCEPTGATPVPAAVGRLTVLADRPGLLQVKVDDGLFMAYHSLVYGYRTFSVGAAGEQALVDLEGRWGLSENHGGDPLLGDLTNFFPGVFDIEREDIVTADAGIQQDGQVSFQLSAPTGEALGQLVCSGQTADDGATALCVFVDPTDAAEPLFRFYQLGPSRLGIEYARATGETALPPGGTAIRMD